MTREELLELAPLDAFGLLDEVEAALFHRAFHQAPPTVQDEVIALQAELVAADHFLSDDEPRPILRRKVLLRLEEVMDESAEELRPIAQIGSRGPEASGRGVRGQAGPGGAEGDGKGLRGLANPANPDAVADLESLATFRSLMEEFAERNARSAARTTPFWRAAAIVLGTALVVSLYMLRDTSEHAKKISELVIAQGIELQIGALVPDLQARLAAGARCLSMVPAPDMSGGLASAARVVDAARGEVIVRGRGLPRVGNGALRCTAVSGSGQSAEIANVDCGLHLACGIGELPEGFVPVRFVLTDDKDRILFTVDA